MHDSLKENDLLDGSLHVPLYLIPRSFRKRLSLISTHLHTVKGKDATHMTGEGRTPPQP